MGGLFLSNLYNVAFDISCAALTDDHVALSLATKVASCMVCLTSLYMCKTRGTCACSVHVIVYCTYLGIPACFGEVYLVCSGQTDDVCSQDS